MSIFGKNVRWLRKKHNMSQEDLSDKLGYKSFTTIQKWESGITEPTLGKVHQVANIFNVDITDLTSQDLSMIEINQTSNQNSTYTSEELKILDPYSQLNAEGKEKAVSYTWDLVDSNKYINLTREEMITYLSDIELAAFDGQSDIRTMTDDELKTLYTTFKEEGKWPKEKLQI